MKKIRLTITAENEEALLFAIRASTQFIIKEQKETDNCGYTEEVNNPLSAFASVLKKKNGNYSARGYKKNA